MTITAQVLKGSQNKRIRELQFHTLSTYGLMKHYKEKEIVNMINYLLAEGYLLLTDSKYPVVKLSESAIPVLKRQEVLYMKTAIQDRVVETEENSDLFATLRSLRKKIADHEKVPPYVVFADTALREMCRYYPVKREAMLEIKGVGQMKYDKYGELFIDEIKRFMIDRNIQIESPASARQSGESDQEHDIPSYLLSYQYYVDGMIVNEIAKKRNLSPVTIQDHILRSVKEGNPIEWESIFDTQIEEHVLIAAQKVGKVKLKPIKELVPADIDYFMIKAVLTKAELEEMK